MPPRVFPICLYREAIGETIAKDSEVLRIGYIILTNYKIGLGNTVVYHSIYLVPQVQ